MGISAALFLAGSALLAWLSRGSLARPRTHGFYRFFAWECLLALLSLNWRHWFEEPFAARQIVSWLLLVGAIPLVIAGVRQLERGGAADARSRTEPGLFAFEKTTSLVTSGVYGYIRHPLYASLLALTWGVTLKQPSAPAILLALATTALLVITSRLDELECVRYFGTEYVGYMKRSWMFVPFVI